MTDGWIVIPNWDKFQYRFDRPPVWIKVYTELNSRDDWRRLSFSQRGLLVSIWAEYARSGARLTCGDLWGRVGQRDKHGNLEALIQAGFVEVSGAPRAPSHALARTEKRKRRLEKSSSARTRAQEPAHFETSELLNDLAPDDVAHFASKLRDADRGTHLVLRKLRRDVPFAAFSSAYQALEERRTRKPALDSECRYFVATVQQLTKEWKRTRTL